MMSANIDVMYVHLIPEFDQERTNLFQALNQLRAQGYDVPKVVALPEVKKQFEEQGTEGASSSQAEMAKLLQDEYARLGLTAKSIGLSVN